MQFRVQPTHNMQIIEGKAENLVGGGGGGGG